MSDSLSMNQSTSFKFLILPYHLYAVTKYTLMYAKDWPHWEYAYIHLKQYLSSSFILSAYRTGIESVKWDQNGALQVHMNS